jgi:hypothetical protein
LLAPKARRAERRRGAGRGVRSDVRAASSFVRDKTRQFERVIVNGAFVQSVS